jgi:hypothetical protein
MYAIEMKINIHNKAKTKELHQIFVEALFIIAKR